MVGSAGSLDFTIVSGTGTSVGVRIEPGAFATVTCQVAIAYPPFVNATFTASAWTPSASPVVSSSSVYGAWFVETTPVPSTANATWSTSGPVTSTSTDTNPPTTASGPTFVTSATVGGGGVTAGC